MQALNAMADLVYCPRCSTPCLERDDLAQCSRCHFAFCAICFASWHPGEPCSDVAGRIAALEARAARANVSSSLSVAQQAEVRVPGTGRSLPYD